MTVTATGFAFDPDTREWTKPVTYEARDQMEAQRWITFNRDWFKNLHIETDGYTHS